MTQSHPDFLDPVETAPREWLDRMQEAAIIRQVHHGYDNAPLIRDIWSRAGVKPSDIKSMADFRAKAPMFDKDDQRAFRDKHHDLTGGFVPIRPGAIMSVGTTSGTTGDPTPVANPPRSPSEVAYARAQWSQGARPGDYVTELLFTYRGGHRNRYAGEIGFAKLLFAMHPAEMPRIAEGSRRYRPTSMKVFASPFILAMEHYIEQSGDDPVDIFSSYKGVIFGGEPLSARLAALTESWGIELFETTAFGEVSSANHCRMHKGFHAPEDHGYIETVDPVTGEPVADGGLGELVVTMFVDPMMPMLRYRTGDLVVIDREACGCGSTHARFDLLGRASDQIVVDGRSILPREIMGLVESESATRANLFQIIRPTRELHELRIRIGYDPDRLDEPADSLRDRLRDKIAVATGVPTSIELIDQAELLKQGPPHKIPRVAKQ